MNAVEQNRRSFLFSMGALGIGYVLTQGLMAAQTAARQGYVVGPTEGEHLLHFRDRGNIFIKVISPKAGLSATAVHCRLQKRNLKLIIGLQ